MMTDLPMPIPRIFRLSDCKFTKKTGNFKRILKIPRVLDKGELSIGTGIVVAEGKDGR